MTARARSRSWLLERSSVAAVAAIAIVAPLLLCSCDDDPVCEAGQTRPCSCPAGEAGVQACAAELDGWGGCVCGGADGDADSDADGDADGDGDGDGDGGPSCEHAGAPAFTGPDRGVIGPAGGVVEQTDTSSGIAGVRVEVPAGAWDECWDVRIERDSHAIVHEYPAGFVPFDTPEAAASVRIRIGTATYDGDLQPAPEPLPITLSFPTSRLAPGPFDIAAAFAYDAGLATWRIVLPRAVGSSSITVETTARDDQWSWGLIDLSVVDVDESLRPALEAYLGPDRLAEIEARVDEMLDDAIEFSQTLSFTCDALVSLRDFFKDMMTSAWTEVDETQASWECGPCNPLTQAFEEELEEFRAATAGVDFAFELAGGIAGGLTGGAGGVLVELAAIAVAGAINSLLIGQYAFECDFLCFSEHYSDDWTMELDTYVFYAADFFAKFVADIAQHYIDPPCSFEDPEGDDVWECTDGDDNDEDTLSDCFDPGCVGHEDCR